MEMIERPYNAEDSRNHAEDDWGNVEYKRRLVSLSDKRREELITQIRWRLSEGGGTAVYKIGISDDGEPKPLSESDYQESVSNLLSLVNRADAEPVKMLSIKYPDGRKTFTLTIIEKDCDYDEYRWLFLGGVGAGKTTIIGCISGGRKDDGKGSVRNSLLRHMHELETGSTTRPTIAYKKRGEHMLALIDMPGAKKYHDTIREKITAYRPHGIVYIPVNGDDLSSSFFSDDNYIEYLSSTIKLPIIEVDTGYGRSSSAGFSSADKGNVKNVVSVDVLVDGGCETLIDAMIALSRADNVPKWPVEGDNSVVTVCEVLETPDLGTVVHGVVMSGTLRQGSTLCTNMPNMPKIVLKVGSIHRYRKATRSVPDDTIATFIVEEDGVDSDDLGCLTTGTSSRSLKSLAAQLKRTTVLYDARVVNVVEL
jgi:GTPase